MLRNRAANCIASSCSSNRSQGVFDKLNSTNDISKPSAHAARHAGPDSIGALIGFDSESSEDIADFLLGKDCFSNPRACGLPTRAFPNFPLALLTDIAVF